MNPSGTNNLNSDTAYGPQPTSTTGPGYDTGTGTGNAGRGVGNKIRGAYEVIHGFVDLNTILSEEDRTSTIELQGPLDTLQKIAFATDCVPVGAEGVPVVNGRVEAVGVAV
ncbi:hypothetical protein NMY22_g3386 [Coprinellus aureogranulatus]|nr:hypothetical protein NMY22_g3386 [Coprinellus aureogranulatus]